MTFILAVIIFGLLIFFHELGHFLFAKLFKVHVQKFSIGFGPKLLSKKYGETEYMLSAIPLGGYVKMYGEQIDEEIDQNLKEKAFNAKPLYARSLIVFAGPLFNFILAFILFSITYIIGIPMLTTTIGDLQKDMPAYLSGIQKGDVITSINGHKVTYWDEMSSKIKENAGKQIELEINRGNNQIKISLTPKSSTVKNIFGENKTVGLVGISPADKIVTSAYSFTESIYLGLKKTYEVSELTILGIIKLFQKIVPADNIGGPIMIFQMAKDTASAGLTSMILFMAVISINLAVLNLLPIPVLDGGHLLFNLIEAVIRRPVSIKIREYAQMVGMSLLLGLMAFAFYNDIMRIFKG